MLINEKEVAALLSISVKSVQEWRCSGKGPAFVKLGTGPKAAVRYRPADVEEFISANVLTITGASVNSARAAAAIASKMPA